MKRSTNLLIQSIVRYLCGSWAYCSVSVSSISSHDEVVSG